MDMGLAFEEAIDLLGGDEHNSSIAVYEFVKR